MKIIKPPEKIQFERKPLIFLAGSIEMGKAVNWQDYVIDKLSDLDVTILNPRRDGWDESWEQSINNPQFKEQVLWELHGLEKSSTVAMYFDPKTKAPITLLELGLHASKNGLIVCCPEGFWRKGNVDIVCENYGIETAIDLNDLIQKIRIRNG